MLLTGSQYFYKGGAMVQLGPEVLAKGNSWGQFDWSMDRERFRSWFMLT